MLDPETFVPWKKDRRRIDACLIALRSVASREFWRVSSELPPAVQRIADKQYELFRNDPYHSSLHLKQVGAVWTVRIGMSHRAIAFREGEVFHSGWIGTHEAYNKLLQRLK